MLLLALLALQNFGSSRRLFSRCDSSLAFHHGLEIIWTRDSSNSKYKLPTEKRKIWHYSFVSNIISIVAVLTTSNEPTITKKSICAKKVNLDFCQLLDSYVPTRPLRSSNQLLLKESFKCNHRFLRRMCLQCCSAETVKRCFI